MKTTSNFSIPIALFDQTLHCRPLSVAEYQKMYEAGILGEDEHVELLGGLLKEMSPKGAKHSAAISRIAAKFYPLVLQNKALLRVQDPIILTDHSQPEPDLVLVKPSRDAYAREHPRPDEVLLLIEVAETSLMEDRQVKLLHYAAAQIPEVWIVNLLENILEVYQEPAALAGGGYKLHRDFTGQETVIPQAFPEIQIVVSNIFSW